jgi:23S rRNA pseudouridine1911/1915/1917 synthase
VGPSANTGASVSAAPAAEIVHLDESLAVIDKPAGLVVHPAPSHRGPTLVDQLADLLGGGDPERPGIVHRLDKDTSGLLVVARTEEAQRALAAEVAAREVDRVYLALVRAHLESRTGTVDAPIGRERRTRTRLAVSGGGAREARTHVMVLELLPADSYVEVRLETGRTHQIRAHFAAIGHPLVGDPTYGTSVAHGLRRQFLHAHRLAFVHPTSGERLDFTSALPSDLDEALEQARRR